ncbi:hypothetical protein ACWDSD_06900 [Streptomyces spiralis]
MTDVSTAPAAPRAAHTAGRVGRVGRARCTDRGRLTDHMGFAGRVGLTGRSGRRPVRPARSRIVYLRTLVLLLALLMPGGPVAAYGVYGSYGAHAVPLVAVAGGPVCAAAEHETPDSALRTSVRGSVRVGGPPLRPTPPSAPVSAHAADRPAHTRVPSHPPYRLHALRCVVLRC